mgnify:CR=1 FL=1
MTQTTDTNRQIVLAERPVGAPDEKTLRLETSDVPVPGAGEMLLRVEYLSLDPYMRGRMSAAKSYADPVAIGAPMVGGTVARVVTSNVDGFAEGDWVLSFSGWQDYAISDGVGVTNMGPSPAQPSWALGIMGMPGFTAYSGLMFIGEPKEGETVVTTQSIIDVDQSDNRMFVFDPGITLDTLVRAINNVGAGPGDVMAILEALDQAGAILGELIII